MADLTTVTLQSVTNFRKEHGDCRNTPVRGVGVIQGISVRQIAVVLNILQFILYDVSIIFPVDIKSIAGSSGSGVDDLTVKGESFLRAVPVKVKIAVGCAVHNGLESFGVVFVDIVALVHKTAIVAVVLL